MVLLIVQAPNNASIADIVDKVVFVLHGSFVKPRRSESCGYLTHACPPFQHLLSERLTSLGIRGEPRVPPLDPSETIVLSEHYRL